MIYPVKKVYITQDWGVNEHIYKRFGYKGHNGVDFRIFDINGNRSALGEVYAPHDGEILEAANDTDGYGKYLKVESDKEGSILGHLHKFLVKVGDEVKEGDLIAIADNTGWSTGTHLHWGYYLLPRNRNNGYGGTINQIPLIEAQETNPIIPPSDATISVDRFFKDSRVALLRTPENDYQPNDDEVEYDHKLYENPQKHIERLTGDHKFYDKYVQPHIDRYEDTHKLQIEQLKNTQTTDISNLTLNWQNRLTTANTEFETYKIRKAKGMSLKELVELLILKLRR